MKTVPAMTTLNAAPTLGQITKLVRNIGSPNGAPEVTKLIERLRLDREAVQQLLLRSEEIIPALVEGRMLIEVLETLSFPNKFTNKEMKSRGIMTQILALQKLFPGIGSANKNLLAQIKKGVVLPVGAEGLLTAPHWSKIAGSYPEACEKVLDLLEKTYGSHFIKWNKGEIGPKYLREGPKKSCTMESFQREQNADILIFPAHFDICLHGPTTRRTRLVMNDSDFGLGVYEIGIMLLTHSQFLNIRGDEIWANCAGDEYASSGDGNFTFKHVPCFEFNNGSARLTAYVGKSYDFNYYSSLSGFAFLPK